MPQKKNTRSDQEWMGLIRECRASGLPGDTKVCIVTGRTDMRRSFDGLMAIIRDTYQMDPYVDALYLFCGRKRNTLKALYFDQTRFVLCTKRLDNGKSQWPRDASEVEPLTICTNLLAYKIKLCYNKHNRVINAKNNLFVQ